MAFTTKARSSASVVKLRSWLGGEVPEEVVVVVWPWPLASGESTPAFGTSFRNSFANAANDRPEDPAPWWVTIRGPEDVGGVR